MTNQQTKSVVNTPNSQKKATINSDWHFNCANKKRKYQDWNEETHCNENIIRQCEGHTKGKEGETPSKFTLEAYCKECREKIEKKIDENIPLEGRNADLTKCDKVVQDYFEKILRNGGKGLFLWGKSGRGKTWSQYAIMKRIIFLTDPYYPYSNVKIISMSKIYSDLTEGPFNNRNFKPSEYKNELCNTAYLMIDDIGMEKMSDFRQEQLEYIIDTRCKNEMLTFFTSNYNLDQLADRVGGEIAGDRIISRIVKMCEIVELEGNDKRMD